MLEKVLNTIKKNNLIQDGDKVLIGVSGGPDSMALLSILYKIQSKIKFQLAVAHINHMIREDANSDEEYVINFCKDNNIPVYTKRINILELANNNKTGIEETGRKARYEFFEEVAKEISANKIATAHNLNDSCETIIMNVLRGSGISGLKGIEAVREKKYIRPIIEISREEIEKYCKEENLNPRYDYTNKDNKYTRNKIRNIIIPYIKEEFNPNIINTLNRLSGVAAEEEKYIEKQVEISYNAILEKQTKEEVILDLKKFNQLDIVIRKKIILFSIKKVVGNIQEIDNINIEDIIKLCDNNIGNKFLTPNKYTKILLKNKKIYVTKLLN